METATEEKPDLTTPEAWTWYRGLIKRLGESVGEWAGIPTPLSDQELVIHPKYKFAKLLNDKREEKKAGWKVRVVNSWHSVRLNRSVCVCEEEGSAARFVHVMPYAKVDHILATLGAHIAWEISAETKAQEKLATLVPHHIFRMYLFTGTFIERSERSKVVYVFRRCRPTIAIRSDESVGQMYFLAALCLHPIGYYEGSFAGAMVPTDEVIAHLLLMRADEHRFWKQANQHSIQSI